MSLKVSHTFSSNHEDYIHDLSYDYYGKRLASCSSDQKVKIYDSEIDNNGNIIWKLTSEIKSHSGVVNKVIWCNPEYGSIIASCSNDRFVNIFQEIIDTETNRTTWTSLCHLVDARDIVTDIKFAPRHIGLKLATCSADGIIRIYEAIDTMNLTSWSVSDEFEADKKDANCISWNSSPFDPPSLVVATSSSLKIWQYMDKTRRYASVLDLPKHDDVIHDVSWAPSMGRSFSLIATACKDGNVRIFKVFINPSTGKFECTLAAKLSSHGSEVWRVDWNMTGTVLASSGDDSTIRLYKADFSGQWSNYCVVSGDKAKNIMDQS